jgi:hypothetical protein
VYGNEAVNRSVKASSGSDLYYIGDQPAYTNYSNINDWQNMLRLAANMKDKTAYNYIALAKDMHSSEIVNLWDKNILVEIPARILSLAPRNWIMETLKLLEKKYKPDAAQTFNMNLTIDRKLLQISQHFRWFLWSLAA